MTVIATLLANAKAISDKPRTTAYWELSNIDRRVGAFDLEPSLAAANEEQSIAQFNGTVTAGTYTLTITLASGLSFTTAALQYNDSAATIQSAIDTAAAAAGVPNWANGDIVAAGGDLTAAAVTLTFSGTSVANKNHALTAINGTLTGGTVGAVTTITDGQSDRLAWAVLKQLSIIGGTVPAEGDDPSAVTAILPRGRFPFSLSDDTVRALIVEAAVRDGNKNVETTLYSLLGF